MADTSGSTDAARPEGNNLCTIYAILIENQLQSDDPDMEIVYEHLNDIKQFCGVLSTPAGETPEQLEPYQFTQTPE